ncbi:MAG: hypothetical protein PHF21_00620 [Bacilli bacterium]|nr:hypothetical protein [Bacilli bacterium]
MKKILLMWVFVSIILVGLLTFFGINLKNKNQAYYELENKIKDSAINYYKEYPDKIFGKEHLIIDKELINQNFLNELKFKNEVCTGYVIIKKNCNYKPYIKCDKYTTKDYNKIDLGAA